jgi:hypothetical protein
MADAKREENVYMAKLAEQAERYDEVRGPPSQRNVRVLQRLRSFP